MYSFRIEQAIRAASVLHKNQVRKGELPFPYITHLVSVAFILFDYTDDEDVIIAALLHDTLEDTSYTPGELQEDFGGHVKDIVLSLTEPEIESGADMWKKRKAQYLKQLKSATPEALLIAAADKIHNMRTVVEAYYEHHHRFIKDFGGTLDERIENYEQLAKLLNKKLDSPILEEFNHVFTEYKQFIYEIKEAENRLD